MLQDLLQAVTIGVFRRSNILQHHKIIMLDTLVIPCSVLLFSHAIYGPLRPNILWLQELEAKSVGKDATISFEELGRVVEQVPWYGRIPVFDGGSEVE